jgi:NADPH:quinone reductase-like Zn-dependent oxidoreductase
VGRSPPLALGVEAAGEVVDVGPGVEWPAPGTGVMTHPLPLPYQGCWAERLVAPARLVAERPDNASWAQAAAFPVPAVTAEQVVSEALAALRGATMIATASRRSAERAMALGASVVLDYHDPQWPSRATYAAGSSGIRAAANAARGGEADALRAITDGGRLATITGAPPPIERDISIANVYVRPDGDQLRRLAVAFAEGKLHVDIGASYPLARAAQRLAQATKGAGAAVVLAPQVER